MATIIGGVAASHTPTIGFAYDRDKRGDPAWTPVFEAFDPLREWLEQRKPDVLLFICNDHVTSFFFDHYSAFALGVGEQWNVADEGGGVRNLPGACGDPAFAAHLGRALMADEFDMSFFQERPLDHGCFSPLSMLCSHEGGWPVRIVPLQVGVLQFPIPTARRCWRLGQALRRAIESYPEDLKVAIVATGGLSHQVHGERAGFNNPQWDERFLDLIERDPERLADMTHAQYAELGGVEGAEVIMWLIMRGALSAQVRCLHRNYYLPSMTGIATAIYEDLGCAPSQAQLQRRRARELTDRRSTLNGYMKFNALKVGAGVIARNNEGSTTPKSNLWFIGASYNVTPQWVLDGELFKLDFKNSPNEAKLYALRATYNFSKRTAVYANVGRIDNSGTLALSVSNAATGVNPAAGQAQNGLGIGIRHSF